MKIITVAAIKGGTGKTTTAAAIAQAARASKKKVLAIDLDPQANFTYCLGADQTEAGSYDLLHGADAAEIVQRTAQGIDVIAGASDLATEKTKAASLYRLRDGIEPIKENYDYIIIDTPPTISEVTYNALMASTHVIISLLADGFSLQGLYQITDIINQIQAHNDKLKILGTVITQYDNRPKVNRYLKEVITDKGQEIGAPLLCTIRKGIAITEAQAMQQSLFDYAPKSKPAQDYKELYKIISKRR